jgi:hypothetical protein
LEEAIAAPGSPTLSDVAEDGQQLDYSSSIEDALPTVLDTEHPVPVVGKDGGLTGVLYPDHVGEVLSPSSVQAGNDDTPPDMLGDQPESDEARTAEISELAEDSAGAANETGSAGADVPSEAPESDETKGQMADADAAADQDDNKGDERKVSA